MISKEVKSHARGADPIATMLHISDLHFTATLQEKGRSIGTHVFGIGGQNSHAFAKLDNLSAKAHAVQLSNKIDMVIVTGDVTTVGDVGSLQNAKTFLTTPGRISQHNRRITDGLGSVSRRLLVIPGNHDRYGGSATLYPTSGVNTDLEAEFNIGETYPYAVAFRRASAEDAPRPAVIVFALDSTYFGKFSAVDLHRRAAAGMLGKGQIDGLSQLANEIRTNGVVKDFDGTEINVNYDECIKIAVLHHHPVKKDGTIDTRIASTDNLLDASDFIQACEKADIDITLFGHRHERFIVKRSNKKRSGRSMFHVCCPTTTEYKGPNGFSIMSIFENHAELDQYDWTNNGFDLTGVGRLVF